MTNERRNVIVEAKPEPFPVDPSRTAVVVVDMQNDFGAEGGMFARAGIPIAAIAAAVDRIAQVLDAARRAGMTVVYLTMQSAASSRLRRSPASSFYRPDRASYGEGVRRCERAPQSCGALSEKPLRDRRSLNRGSLSQQSVNQTRWRCHWRRRLRLLRCQA
jgi:hypothetical protein